MIEINLLPEELKKKKAQKFKAGDLSSVDFSNFSLKSLQSLARSSPVVKWVAVGIGAMAVFQMLLFVTGLYGQMRIHSISKKYDEILPRKQEADRLRAQSESINRKVGAINELMVKRFSWARKLNALSDSMTTGVWLNELSYESKIAERIAQKSSAAKGKKNSSAEKMTVSYIVLSGYTSQMGESGASLVGKFIKSLKNNANFYSDFNDIALVSIKSDKADNQEVMSFKITCPFKDSSQ